MAAWSPDRIRADCVQRRALIDWADELALWIMAERYRDHPDYPRRSPNSTNSDL